MTTVAAAIAAEQYELAALRLLLGVAGALGRLDAPRAREELIALLAFEDDAADDEVRR